MSKTESLVSFFDQPFNIPHYQRGYRWEEQEVHELLDDLWAFSKDRESGDFYCLQPIVLKKNEAKHGFKNETKQCFDVLDGQQRLTTLYLLLVYLEDKRKEDNYNKPLFRLKYETRKKSEEFLIEQQFKKGIDETNIDYYHICKAYQAIDEWFLDEKHAGAKSKLVPILMDDIGKGNRNVRFIRYEVPAEDTKPIDVFIRLNVGKIPLTDAELIKALLLQQDKYDEDEIKYIGMRLFEIATEWDRIEYALQEEGFWFFLSNSGNEKPTHIEFIFDLVAKNLQKEKKYFKSDPKKHATFLILSQYVQDLLDNGINGEQISRIKVVETVWEQITTYFEYFKEWYSNRELYHYIGFLIAVRGNNIIDDTITKSKLLGKKKLIEELEAEIGKFVLIDKKRKNQDDSEITVNLDNLNYENEDQSSHDRKEILDILLLHNVYASLKSDKEKARFPFSLYKKTKRHEKWSLEHIHARNSTTITDLEGQRSWIRDHVRSLKRMNPVDADLLSRMETLLVATDIDNQEFEDLVDDVYQAIDTQEDSSESRKHRLENLCLLDSATNSMLSNSVFDVKREKIKKREVEGAYVPICTRNVFMKAYTEYPANNFYWTAEDRTSYLNDIRSVYEYFIGKIPNSKK